MQKKWAVFRRLSQVLFFFLFVTLLWYSISPKIFFIFDPLIALGVSIAQRVFLKILIPSAVLLISTAILGRFFCGWICPMGFMIDFAGLLRNKIANNRKKEYSRHWLRYVKFIILGILIVAAFFGIQVLWWVDPVTIASRFVSMSLMPFVVNLNEGFFEILLKATGFPEFLMGAYRRIRMLPGGIRTEYFVNASGIFSLWLAVMLLTVLSRRFWCRAVCPLGALLALFAKISPFKIKIAETCTTCKKCVSDCRMGAIKEDCTYNKEECILCMDCVCDCPVNAPCFSFIPGKKDEAVDDSRRNFIRYAGMTSLALFAGGRRLRLQNREGPGPAGVIRPPGALKEKDFIVRCIRCGNCMRVCVTNGLQPTMLESGLEGIWTPQLIPEIGACEYLCVMCTRVCPTGAIPELKPEEKKIVKLGTARVNRARCLPWKGEKHCIVCEEHCPVEEKAIKLEKAELKGDLFLMPVVDKGLCVGCGTCQNVCPVRPFRAITVNPAGAHRK